ncbi:MAG: Uma2 family endonuclease [Candidatus Omnitrophota bacterium]|nr:MAG: Uma2 family endonuclease [Candidatus Omnitrophota bacterium]
MPIPKEKEKYTYQDYAAWPDEERWELIDGQAYDMSPAPTFDHQTIVLNFAGIVRNALKGKPCVPGIAPTDIVLSEHDVVQPDFFVVCDREKIKTKNIQGAPDLVVEVLSPSTSKKDRWIKRNLYERYGVREYLIIDPDAKYVERYCLSANHLFDKGEVFDWKDTLPLKSLESIDVPLWEVFGEQQPAAE